MEDARYSAGAKPENMREYSNQPVLYVYPGEICSKRKKKSQIYNAYGGSSYKNSKQRNGHSGVNISGGGMSRNSNADNGGERIKLYRENEDLINSSAKDGKADAKERQSYRQNEAKAYNVRYSAASGGGERAESVRRRKISIESIVNLFGTTEERRRGDMEDAKRKAVSRRRFVQHKRKIITAALILAVFAIILLTIYKVFFVVRNISVEGTSTYTSEDVISSSGIYKGVNLYSFRSSLANNNITFHCPYIESVNVHRNVPSGVLFEVTEDVPLYYAEIYGEYKILSDGLRVLETVNADDERLQSLIKLKLPKVSYSVAGRVMEFENAKEERSVRDVLKSISSSLLSDRVTMADLRNTYEMSVAVDKKFLLKDLKLKTAAYVLEDEMFTTGNKAKIDLTDTEKTSVIIDNKTETE